MNENSDHENEHGHDPEPEHEEHENEENEQHEIYETTLRKQASIDRRSRASTSNHGSRPGSARALSSQSMNFEKKASPRQSQTRFSDIFLKDPYMSSINDMKYLGDQFRVGKTDPNLKSVFESKFEKLYQSKLNKLSKSTSRLNPIGFLTEFRRTKDMKTLMDPQFTLTNELKFTGDQFKVGRPDPKIQSSFERRFQERFKHQLKNLLPNTTRNPRNLSFYDLKDIHNALLITRPNK